MSEQSDERERENQLRLADHHLSAVREILKWRLGLLQLAHFAVGYGLWASAQKGDRLALIGLVLIAAGMFFAFRSSWRFVLSYSGTALAYLDNRPATDEEIAEKRASDDQHRLSADRNDRRALICLALSGAALFTTLLR